MIDQRRIIDRAPGLNQQHTERAHRARRRGKGLAAAGRGRAQGEAGDGSDDARAERDEVGHARTVGVDDQTGDRVIESNSNSPVWCRISCIDALPFAPPRACMCASQ